MNSSPRPPPTSRRTAKKSRTPLPPGGASGLAPAPAAALALAFFVQAAPRRVAVAGVPGTVGRARGLLRSAGASHTRVGPRDHARSAPGEAFAGGGLLRRSARVAFTPTVAVVALTIVRGAAPVITVVAVRTVLLGGAAAVDRRVGPGRKAGLGARRAIPRGVVAAALVAAVPAEGEQEDEEDDDYRDARDDTCVGCTDNYSLSHFSALMRPCWLRRAVRNRHRHAIEQASRRWRGGRRGDSGRTRRKFDFHTATYVVEQHFQWICPRLSSHKRCGHRLDVLVVM